MYLQIPHYERLIFDNKLKDFLSEVNPSDAQKEILTSICVRFFIEGLLASDYAGLINEVLEDD